jgi:hypothetical protein
VSIEKEFETEMAKISQKDRANFLDNIMKLIKLEVENQIDLGTPGIGTGINDERQRDTEQNSEAYSTRGAGASKAQGSMGNPTQGQPPAQ